jgi:hypothetical protein
MINIMNHWDAPLLHLDQKVRNLIQTKNQFIYTRMSDGRIPKRF